MPGSTKNPKKIGRLKIFQLYLCGRFDMSIVIHSIIPCDMDEKAKNFYSQLFPNWHFEAKPPNQFWEVTNEDGSYPHSVYLAMMKGSGTPSTPTNYYEVDDIDAFIKKAVTLGGKITVPKTPVPGVGFYAGLLDVIGNNFGFWENNKG
jgi:predicted enzyme related to lactoylglutathione lyase